jgi:hypothetical protein
MDAFDVHLRTKCPQCFHAPSLWRERPAHGSRELYWIGCKADGHLAGGNSQHIAVQNWNRLSAQWAFAHRGHP